MFRSATVYLRSATAYSTYSIIQTKFKSSIDQAIAMNLLIVGINHNTAPLELREQVAFTPEQLAAALDSLRDRAGLVEAAILSTCNRTEVIATSAAMTTDKIEAWLADYQQLRMADLKPALYARTGRDAVLHAMRVACGLDSMITGEPQILGQFKDCFVQAKRFGTLGPELDHLAQTTFRIAKRVRTETAIGESSVSVAATAVTLARQLFSDLTQCNLLLIGAGDTIESVARHIHQVGIRSITIANRTLANAQRLAHAFDGEAIELQSIPHRLGTADLVITSTASPLPILGKGTVERVLKTRRHQPILMVDLAVPRDIEPEVAGLKDIYLYSIDSLQEIINQNLNNRREAAGVAEAILVAEADTFRSRKLTQQETQTLVQFRGLHNDIKQQELDKAVSRLQKGDDPEEVLVTLANQLVNKILHTPSLELKAAAAGDRQALLDAIATVYQLAGRRE